jgi:FkbM family methyltransferase
MGLFGPKRKTARVRPEGAGPECPAPGPSSSEYALSAQGVRVTVSAAADAAGSDRASSVTPRSVLGEIILHALPDKVGMIEVSVPGIPEPILIRGGTTDRPTFLQVFTRMQYEVELGFVPKTIIDAGANVGYAAIYFLSRYPDARVVAVEPETSNVELARRNTQSYPNVEVVQAALWSHRTHLRIEDPGEGHWAFQVRETDDEGGIAAITVEDCAEYIDADVIDILKLDIEGAEVAVLGEPRKWLDRVNVLIIELHDRFQPGCEAALEEMMAGQPFVRQQVGENIIFTRQPLLFSAARASR